MINIILSAPTIDDGLDILYDYVDKELWKRNFNKLLKDINKWPLEKIDHCILVGILTTTIPIKNHPLRIKICNKIREIIKDDELLEGLF